MRSGSLLELGLPDWGVLAGVFLALLVAAAAAAAADTGPLQLVAYRACCVVVHDYMLWR
jgi:hypothetical protein